jgi:two-component system CheB/CheR fusion protein
MAREGLRHELTVAFARALGQEAAVVVRGLRVGTNGDTQTVDLTVQRLAEPRELRGLVMVAIADVAARPAGPAARQRGPAAAPPAELVNEAQRLREELQTTREEMQTSQEELKSTNEELQSTNEELQSSNEELTTSKEEMQSMNEELQTVNAELQAKVDELSRAANDMKNLLNSTDIATLFLDGDLRVRRFTTQTSKLIRLIPADTGRPITDLASELHYPALAEDTLEVLRTLASKETQVAARDGRWYTVRIMPYRTLENVIDGVVITFTDTTTAKLFETSLHEREEQLRQIAESLPILVWSCRPDGSCDYLSRQWGDFTGQPEAAHLGFGWLESVHPDDRERVRAAFQDALRAEEPLVLTLRLRSREGAYHRFTSRAVPIRDGRGAVVQWYGTHREAEDAAGERARE